MADSLLIENDPGWQFGPTDNPDRASFDQGYVDSGTWGPDPGSSSSSGSGSAKDWAAGFKDIAGGLKGAGLPSPGTPQANNQRIAPNMHPGSPGSLGVLLQLLANRAAAFNAAAHQGAVPARVQNSQGLLGF
jgi:hypothetical protein